MTLLLDEVVLLAKAANDRSTSVGFVGRNVELVHVVVHERPDLLCHNAPVGYVAEQLVECDQEEGSHPSTDRGEDRELDQKVAHASEDHPEHVVDAVATEAMVAFVEASHDLRG